MTLRLFTSDEWGDDAAFFSQAKQKWRHQEGGCGVGQRSCVSAERFRETETLGLKSLDFSHYILFCLLACLFSICAMSLACFHIGAVIGVLHLPRTWRAEVGGLLWVQGQARLIVSFRSVWVTEWYSNPPLHMSLCVHSGVANIHSPHWVEEKKGNFVPGWASVVVAATAWEKLQTKTSPVSHRDLPHIELEVFLWQAFNKPPKVLRIHWWKLWRSGDI